MQHRFAQFIEQRKISLPVNPLNYAVENLDSAGRANPARRALAAGLDGAELHRVTRHPGHVDRIVEDHDSAMAEQPADLGEGLVVDGGVELRGGHVGTQRPADLHCPDGPACHTGSLSCFAPGLWRTISERAKERPEGSYTVKLLEEGTAACARKLGEEAVELVTAALAETEERVVAEAADLVYHLYVLLASRGVDLAAVEEELAGRAR